MTERAFKSAYSPVTSLMSKKGKRISFIRGYIKTEDEDVIATLEEFVKAKRGIEEVAVDQVPDLTAKPSKKKQGDGSPITPSDLMARVKQARSSAGVASSEQIPAPKQN